MRKTQALEGAALGGALAIFLGLTLYQLELPGLYYDEAADAVLSLQMVLGQPVELFKGAGLWLGDMAYPLMVMDYVGAVNSYLLVPFFAVLGIGVESLRLLTVLSSVMSLALTYFLTRSLFGWVEAALAALLLAVHPSFVFWSRQGIYVTSLMAPLALGGMLCLRRWQRKGSSHWFVLGLFLLGLGVSAKLLFFWVVIALTVLYLALSRKPVSIPQALGGFAALVLGAGMPIVYNLQGQGTFALFSRNLLKTEQGVNNLDMLPNLATRAGDVFVLLDGSFFWFLGGIFRNPIYPYVFLSCAGILIVFTAFPGTSAYRVAPHLTVVGSGGAGKPRLSRLAALAWLDSRPFLGPVAASLTTVKCSRTAYRKRVGLILGFIALIFLQSGATISGLWPTHFFILLPFAAMVIGAAVWLLPRALPWTRAARIAVLVFWAALWLSSLANDLQYHQALGETGGWMAHSDGVYRLAQSLEKRDGPQPLAMDWGIKASVQILTAGRINPQEVFQYQPEPDQSFFDLTYKAMQDTRRLYVFRAPELTVYPRFEQFQSLAKRLGKNTYLEETITQRDGRPLYLVYTAK